MAGSAALRWRRWIGEMARGDGSRRWRLVGKGRLKEQDALIEFIIRLHEANSSMEVMRKLERWIAEHLECPQTSTLRRLVPTIGRMFTPLELRRALREYDAFAMLSRRKHVLPNFAEMRHILNLAQVHAAAGMLRLITFDADGTLYDDGTNFEHDNEIIYDVITLLRSGIHVAVVTAASYPGEPERFEMRMRALLDAFRLEGLSEAEMSRFHIVGGECNYLLRCSWPEARLAEVAAEAWQLPEMLAWREDEIHSLLDAAERALVKACKTLRLPVLVIRKERSVGVVPKNREIKYEILEEIALAVSTELRPLEAAVPYCVFNGGSDVFCDIGNKSIGIQALMQYLGPLEPGSAVHVGDRFTQSGNDYPARNQCNILWVAEPEETVFFVRVLLQDLKELGRIPAFAAPATPAPGPGDLAL
eukprot:tig00001542_g9322.t1